MKYELTETETLAMLATVERLFDKVFAVARRRIEPTLKEAWEEVKNEPTGPGPVSLPAAPMYGEFAHGHRGAQASVPELPIPEGATIVAPHAAYPAPTDGRGQERFTEFYKAWIENFDVLDAPQPDRAERTRELANDPLCYQVLRYVSSKGGLTHAVDAHARQSTVLSWDEGAFLTETELRAFVVKVATTMCQVSSILFPELADLYEHRDIYRGK